MLAINYRIMYSSQQDTVESASATSPWNDSDFDLFSNLASEWDPLQSSDGDESFGIWDPLIEGRAGSVSDDWSRKTHVDGTEPVKKRRRSGGRKGVRPGYISCSGKAGKSPVLANTSFVGYIPATNQEKVHAFFLLKFFECFNCGDLEMLSDLSVRYCAPDIRFKSNIHTEVIRSVAAMNTFFSYLMELYPDGILIYDAISKATGGDYHRAAYQLACTADGKAAEEAPPADQICVLVDFFFHGTRLSGEKSVAEVYEEDICVKNQSRDQSSVLLTSRIDSSNLPVLSQTSINLEKMTSFEPENEVETSAGGEGAQEYMTTGQTTLVFDANNKICIWYYMVNIPKTTPS